MQVIPVVDLKGGVAVAAVRGDRANYRPLQTPLAIGADPAAVARGLRSLFPFATLYLADLDGIERGVPDVATQKSIAAVWEGSELWIDDATSAPGIAGGTGLQAENEQQLGPLRSHVLGSESLGSLNEYLQASARAGSRAPLSLDFRGDTFLGPPELLADADVWPSRLIVMTLARVGSGEGPDIARLARIVACAGGREVYAAGGVRDADDLARLRDIGVAGALVATALHTGGIARADLERFG